MVRSPAVVFCALALLAGCGSSDSDSDSGSGSGSTATTTTGAGGAAAAAAAKFIACFKQPGYVAEKPAPGEESLFALSARKKGYSAEPVNVAKPNAVAADAFLVFFSSPEEATKAVDEVAVVGEGDVAPLVRGAAVAGFLDQSSRDAVGDAVERCLV